MPLTEPFQESFIALAGWLCQNFEIPIEELKGLDEYVRTEGDSRAGRAGRANRANLNPGRNMTEWLRSPEFEVRFKEYLGIPMPTATPTPVPTATPESP